VKLFFFSFLVFSLFSCNQSDGPEGSLKKYIDYRFSDSQTKEGILKKTTGKMYEYISTLENNELDSFIQLNRVKRKKFKVKSKKCTEDVCFITYIVGYDHLTEGQKTFDVEVKKVAELRLVDSYWKIFDVNNVKTYMNSKEEISP